MTAATITPPRGPRPTENTAGSFVLAVLMHALLVAALWISVQWHTQPQGEVTAELWGALPPPAEVAPPPPPPPVVERKEPEQRDADIVLQQERERKKRLEEEKRREEEQRKREIEQRKLEEAKRKAEEEKRKADEEKRAAAQREALRKAEEQRMLAQAGAGAPTSGSVGGRRGDGDYGEQLRALIKPRIVYAVPEGTSSKIFARVQVDLLPTGEILAVKVLKPSGLPGYDAAVERAIRRTDPFPRKRDGTIDRTITIDFYPVETQ